MNCENTQSLLDPLVDNELPTETVALVMKHISSCSDCQDSWDSRTMLKDRFRALSNKISIPKGAIERIDLTIERESNRTVSFRSPRLGYAIAACVIVMLGMIVVYQISTPPTVTANQLAANYSGNNIVELNKVREKPSLEAVSADVGFDIKPPSIKGWNLVSVESCTPEGAAVKMARMKYESVMDGRVQKIACYQSAEGTIKPVGLVERVMKGKRFCCGQIGKLSLVYWPNKGKDHVLVGEISEKAMAMLAMGVS